MRGIRRTYPQVQVNRLFGKPNSSFCTMSIEQPGARRLPAHPRLLSFITT